jgi:hypothetical protein
LNRPNNRIRFKSKSVNKTSDRETCKEIKKNQKILEIRKRVLKDKYENNSSVVEDSFDDSKDSEAENNSSDESYSSEDDSESYSPSTELVDKIHELVFSKIEMPSSTSNKSILGALEHIETLLDKVDQNEIFDVNIFYFNLLVNKRSISLSLLFIQK